MKYDFEDYDKSGYLKPPIWLILGWVLLARAWLVFVASCASRDAGVKILETLYPATRELYLGMALGLPSIIFLWLVFMRSPERPWIDKIIVWAKGVSLAMAVVQLGLLIVHLKQSFWGFSWLNAITLVCLSWLILYLVRSKRVSDSIKHNAQLV